MSEQLAHHLANGIPYSELSEWIHTTEFKLRISAAEETSVQAHDALYEAWADNAPNVTQLDDAFSGEAGKYLSFTDAHGEALYGQWDPANPASDIGIRGINPLFTGRANQTTVIHADSLTWNDFRERGAPKEVLDAVGSVASLNKFVVAQVVMPFLGRVAELDNRDKRAYQELFYPLERRASTLTRAILYHKQRRDNPHQLFGSDGKPLHIREHVDQSSYSVDVYQSCPGLQYSVDGQWRNAGTDAAVFRGGGEDFRGRQAPAALHRVEDLHDTYESVSTTIARLAIVTFVSPSIDGIRMVRPSSSETHPTEQQAKIAC